ncbi:hypothetical protein [Bradyrhizobium sp. WSM3983]|uniref:hypothetical protein n=1 Tax=Bradyrhizobium sp. WSM3983 TaxID=1038867 RepID=UPI0012EBAF95|nr:hypothetical protein [Bradyrhizobium sp. WSM3983]
MNPTVDLLARGSERVISHYRWLPQRTANDEERAAYERRIAEEQRLLAQLARNQLPAVIRS